MTNENNARAQDKNRTMQELTPSTTSIGIHGIYGQMLVLSGEDTTQTVNATVDDDSVCMSIHADRDEDDASAYAEATLDPGEARKLAKHLNESADKSEARRDE